MINLPASLRKAALILALSISVLGCRLVQTRPQYELYPWEERQLNEQRAQVIESALEAYREAHGYYPESLDDLVPDLLESVPVTVTGDDFHYDTRRPPYTKAPDYSLNYYPASLPDTVCGRGSAYDPGYWDCSMKDLRDKVK